MKRLLLIAHDRTLLAELSDVLERLGYEVSTSTGITDMVDVFENVDLIIARLQTLRRSAFDVDRNCRSHTPRPAIPVIALLDCSPSPDANHAIQFGSAETAEQPMLVDDVIRIVRSVVPNGTDEPAAEVDRLEAHAAARWARIVVGVIRTQRDPRTIADWSRAVFASPGAIKNWCRTAGISPRRSLIFARLLRAVSLGAHGRHRPENLLDVVDMRTLNGLLKVAGFTIESFPNDVGDFVKRQMLIRELDILSELNHALNTTARAITASAFPRPRAVPVRGIGREGNRQRTAK